MTWMHVAVIAALTYASLFGVMLIAFEPEDVGGVFSFPVRPGLWRTAWLRRRRRMLIEVRKVLDHRALYGSAAVREVSTRQRKLIVAEIERLSERIEQLKPKTAEDQMIDWAMRIAKENQVTQESDLDGALTLEEEQ